VNLQVGQKGRLKASEIEFEVVGVGPYAITWMIRYRRERAVYEVGGDDLRQAAEAIAEFKPEK
jgi:hypothetical protein